MSHLTLDQKNQVLATFAHADLRSARKEGKIAIINTEKGTLEVSYTSENRTYSITSFHGGKHLTDVSASAAKAFLVANYTLEPE